MWYRHPASKEPKGCPACGSQDALHLPAAAALRGAWYQAFGDLALTRLPAIQALALPPAPILHTMLGILQPWVQVLGRSVHRLGTSAPSFPLVVAHVVLCAWRLTDCGPLRDIPGGWSYDAREHGRLRPRGDPAPHPTPSYAKGLQCSNCGRLRAAGVSEASTPPPGARNGGCLVSASIQPRPSPWRWRRGLLWSSRGHQPGAVPVGRLQGARCEPPSPSPGPREEYASYALCLPHDPLEHLQRSPPDVGRLRVVRANCGGLGPDTQKVPRLIAYLAYAEPDVAHLREAGPHFAAVWLAGLPYLVCGAPLPGRGPGHPSTHPPAGRLPGA